MRLNGTFIDDTYAEAFGMRYCRVIITAGDSYWLEQACQAFCGYGTSVIACDAEVGTESSIDSSQSPDGRCSTSVLAFAFNPDALAQAMMNRVGQCLMTCPTVAAYNGMPEAEKQIPLGEKLRYFGDGFQKSKLLGQQRYWRIPVMEGEFLVSETLGVAKGVAGGNFILQAAELDVALAAARDAVDAISNCANVITPFPGGVVRSGSKVGSRYPKLVASTNHEFCPTLKARVESKLAEGSNYAYEIVIDGTSADTVAAAMRAGIQAAIEHDLLAISAGNYGGNLGKHHLALREILA